MLIAGYRLEIFRPECNPEFTSLHCLAHLDGDAGPALPYLNAVLGGTTYTEQPPSVMFRSQGKLIAVHADRIAVNALADEVEADKIVAWMVGEINQAWAERADITPSTESAARPQALEVLKLLPRTNCGRCGQATCWLFAVLAQDGVKGPADCPDMEPDKAARLTEYLSSFVFID